MTDTRLRANYALVEFGAHLGPDEHDLDLPWATFEGERTRTREFEVPTADVRDAYVQLQAFDVGEYGHEILINGQPLSGFDIPPASGWQQWMDTVAGAELREGENAIVVRRDDETDDSFAVGAVAVHWREPVDS